MKYKDAVRLLDNLKPDDHESISGTVVVGIDKDGFCWIADNGEITENLTIEDAAELVAEFTQ